MTSRCHIQIGLLKIPGVPGVGNIPGMGSEIQQLSDLPLGVSTANAFHVAEIGLIHAYEQIILVIVLRTKLACLFPSGSIPCSKSLRQAGG